MQFSYTWQSRVALFVTLGLTSMSLLPFMLARSAQAHSLQARSSQTLSSGYLISQRFPDSWRSALPSGTLIPVSYDKAEKILVTPDETSPVTLQIPANILNSSGRLMIPAGSQLEGTLQPANGGAQFVASTLILPDGTRKPISVASNVVTETETITKQDNPNILRGAVVGAAAAAILAEIFGSIDVIEVLAGAGVGTLAEIFLLRHKREVEVIVVHPDQLEVRLQSEYVANEGVNQIQ